MAKIKDNDSILKDVRSVLGIHDDDEVFDRDLIMHINSTFNILRQLGVGPSSGFSINDSSAKWSDFLTDDPKVNMVKSYIYAKVRLQFDPPSVGALNESLKQQIAEYEWRMNVDVETNWGA